MELDYKRISELVIQLQNGNDSVFNELYKLTSPKAYFIALQITKNEQAAEDVLQESYMKMLDKIGTLSKPESFVSWFNNIVANKSKDSLKKKNLYLFEGGEDEAFEVIPDEDTYFEPEENLNKEELRRAVMEAINELTEEKRACVLMMYFGDMSVKEISMAFEIPVSTVKNRAFAARKDLKLKFEKRGITALYSTAPIGAVIWALSQTAEAVGEGFATGTASASVLSGISISSASTMGATATTASVTSTGNAVVTANTGLAAKLGSLSVAQKVVAGIAAVGVAGGSVAGVAAAVKHSVADNSLTTSYVESVTTAPVTHTEYAAVTVTELETAVSVEPSSTKVTQPKATSATERITTTQKINTIAVHTSATAKPTTTVKQTTTTQRVTTTVKQTTTARPTTTVATTRATTTAISVITTVRSATTAAPTTAAPARLTVYVRDNDEAVVDTLSFTVEPGTQMSHEYLYFLVEDAGYTVRAGFDGSAYEATAEAGKAYTLNAYVGF